MPFPCETPIRDLRQPAGSGAHYRCRRCKTCLALRRYQWLIRSACEQSRCSQAWFITLTYGPKSRAAIFSAASNMPRQRSSAARLIAASGRYLTLYLKRLRKKGLKFKYIFVAEQHKDGFPHWHGVLFIQRGTPDATWDILAKQWPAGFTVIKLVREVRAIYYVVKYLSKGATTRVRASRDYGAGCDLGLGNEAVKQVPFIHKIWTK